MKVHSLKNRFILIFLSGTMFTAFIASMGIYGTIKSREEAKRQYEDNNIIVSNLHHLKEDLLETRNRLLNMMITHDKENMAIHRLEMMAIDADIEADFDALLDSKLIGSGIGVREKLLEARSVYLEFKKTRYETLVPLIVAGKGREANEVGSGIQQERYVRVTGLLSEAIQAADGYLDERQKELEANGMSLIFGTILLTGLGFISGAVIFYAYSRDIISRIKSLEEASRRLSEGDLATRVQVRGADEIASLGETFNWMAENIQEANDQLLKNESKLREAAIESQQHARVMEFAAKEREEQNRRLQDAVEEMEAANRSLAETQEKLLQTEKMASIGQLAAGVAHEINNPVGYINCNISALSNYFKDIKEGRDIYLKMEEACDAGDYDKAKEMMDELRRFRVENEIDFMFTDVENLIKESLEGLNRVTSIVKDLKQFSHTGEAEAKEYDINKGLESTLNIVWNEIKYKAEVKKEYGNIPLVYCYPQQLNQVFMNLLVNAAHAMEGTGGQGNGKGLIKIKTYHDNDSVFAEISDSGCGIPEDKIRKIFDPFFTTKPVGKGTGLGLSVVYNIVKKHKGDIDVRSKVGDGTTFTIRLPVNASHEKLQDAGCKLQENALT